MILDGANPPKATSAKAQRRFRRSGTLAVPERPGIENGDEEKL